MAISFVAAGTPGTTSATLPTGTTSGDWVFCFAYRGAAATAPTLPASWTSVTLNNTLPAHQVGYRIYDGVWTMPTWTNATRVVSATVRPPSGHTVAIGVSISENKSQSNVVWPTSTMQNNDGSSLAFKGVVHTRPDAVIGTPTGYTVVDANGTNPGYATFYKTAVTDLNTQTVTVSRSTTYTTFQFEVRDIGPSVTQAAYGFYNDGTETGSTTLAAANTAITTLVDSDVNVLLRERLQLTTAVVPVATDDWQLQYEKNASGTWVNVTTGTTNVAAFNSANLTDAAATTNRLGAGTGSFVAGKVSEDGLVDDLAWTANNYTEVLYSLTLKSADLANADTLRFRTLYNGATTGFTYTQTPTINVTKTAPAITQAAYRWYDEGSEGGAPLVESFTGAVNFDYPLASGFPGFGQTFPGNGTPLVEVQFWLRQTAGGVGTATSKLYALDGFGAPTGAALATSTTVINATALGASYSWVSFAFDGSYTLANGTQYGITIETSGANSNGGVTLGFNQGAGATYSRGGAVSFDGSSWSTASSTDLLFRLYAGSTALAAQNTAITRDLSNGDVSGTLLRFLLQSTSAAAVPATDDWQLQWERNTSGTWVNVGAATATVAGFNSTNLTDTAATSSRLTGGTGSFVAGKVSEDGLADDVGWTANNYTELLYSIKIVAADSANADTLRFRLLRNGATTTLTYSQTPSISLTKSTVAITQAAYRWYADGSEAGTALADGFAGPSTVDFPLNTSVPAWGQSFTGNGQPLAQADFWLKPTTGSPTGTVTAKLYAHDNTNLVPTGTALATSTTVVAVSTLIGGYRWVAFAFAGSYTLVNGTKYVITVETSGANSTGGAIVGVNNAAGATHSGNASQFNGSVWTSSSSTDTMFRVYAGPTALAAQNTAVTGDVTTGDAVVLLRLLLQSTTQANVAATDDWQLQSERNASGTWNNVTGNVTAAPYARPYSSANFSDIDPTTNQLTGGTGTFTPGRTSRAGGTNDLGWPGNNYTELLFSFAIINDVLATGDTMRFRLLRNGATTGMTYTQVPTFNVTTSAPTLDLTNTPPSANNTFGVSTTASFTIPVGSIGAIFCHADSDAGNVQQITMSNSGTAYTYNLVGKANETTTTLGGYDAIFWVVGDGVARTMSATPAFTKSTRLTVQVWRNASLTDPFPAASVVVGANTVSQNFTVPYTSTVPNSHAVGVGMDWNNGSGATSTDTYNAYAVTGAGDGLVIRKASTPPTPGTVVTLNFKQTTTPNWNYVVAELAPAVTTTPKLATLTDDFSGTLAKWPDSSVATVITAGQAKLPVASTFSLLATGLSTGQAYDLLSSSIYAQVTLPSSMTVPMAWTNRVVYDAPRNGTTSHTIDPSSASNVASGTPFTPTAGRLLVAIMEGPVTDTTPSGWTLPTNGSAINNSGLYVWYRTAAGSDTLTTTHNGSNYPVGSAVYEFAAGTTFVQAQSATGLGGTVDNPTLSGLTGTNHVFSAQGNARGGLTGGTPTTWAAPVAIDFDIGVPGGAPTDGYHFSIGYQPSYTAATWTPNRTADVTGSAEGLSWAIAAASRTREFFIELRLQGGTGVNNRLYFRVYDKSGVPTIETQRVDAGSYTWGGEATYSSTAHAWLRIRETGGTVYWDGSPDGTTWTQIGTLAKPAWDLTKIAVSFNTGYSGTETASDAYVDNVNTAPSSTSTGKIKWYSGSAFVEKPIKYYNGSAFVAKPLKVWNGSAWVLA